MAEKFRKLELRSGKIALAGRDAESNEKLIEQAGKDEFILHTSKPGSPFVNIKCKTKGFANPITKEDIKEAAIFCAKYSQAWKKAKKKPENVEVHIFLGRDVFKLPGMKPGTFGVKKHKSIKVKREEIE
jgi:predicted ribosome quality control (RQC) complex YloA/Tae2 family protein